MSLVNSVYDCVLFDFFFFKQKTAYEMRISDWSSDVCSSDLRPQDLRDDRMEGTQPATVSGGGGQRDVDRTPPCLWSAEVTDRAGAREIGRASCRERVCQYV